MSEQVPRPRSRPPGPPPAKSERFFVPTMERFCVEKFGAEDDHLIAIREGALARGFPPIAITPMDGQVLSMLVVAANARRAVEIGTLAGYSALWIARALQHGGILDCFEIDVDRAQFALEHLTRAVPPITVAMHIGQAMDQLRSVLTPVDFVFIDADKENYPNYLDWAARSLRSGGIVAMDNAFAWGFLDKPEQSPRPQEALAVRKAVDQLAADKRFRASMIPTNEGLAVGVRV